MDSGLSASARPGMTSGDILAAQFASELVQSCRASEDRGRRECRVRAAPAVSCANAQAKKLHTSIQVKRRTHRHPLRNGFTAYIVLSLVRALGCHHRPRRAELLANLTPAWRRRDHTTLPYAIAGRLPDNGVHRSPSPTVRDDREAPLMWAGDGATSTSDLPNLTSEIFFISGLDINSGNPNLICPTAQFADRQIFTLRPATHAPAA